MAGRKAVDEKIALLEQTVEEIGQGSLDTLAAVTEIRQEQHALSEEMAGLRTMMETLLQRMTPNEPRTPVHEEQRMPVQGTPNANVPGRMGGLEQRRQIQEPDREEMVLMNHPTAGRYGNRLEFPVFSHGDPSHWIFKAEHYFRMNSDTLSHENGCGCLLFGG